MTDADLDLSGRSVFCTGATGFIGTNLTSRLLRRGASVVTLVPEKTVRFENVPISPELTAYRGRIEDSAILSDIFEEHRFDFIVHLAATATIQQAFDDPREAFETNIRGTWNLMETVRQYGSGIKGIVHASTDKVYGEGKAGPYREEDPIEARHVYDISKASGDAIARGYCDNYGLPVTVVRFCNVYGPHDLNWVRIVPNTIRSLHEGRPPVVNMFLDENGNRKPFRRDFIYVDDIVDGLETLLATAESGRFSGETFNFGTGNGYAVDEVIGAINRLYGGKADCEVRIVSSGEIHSQCMSYEKAGRLLGFAPRRSLEDGLTRTVRWYRDYLQRHPADP